MTPRILHQQYPQIRRQARNYGVLGIGVANFGEPGHVPLRLSTIFFSSFRSRTKSITANPIWFSILRHLKNMWNRNERRSITPKSTEIDFVFGRDSAADPCGGAYDVTLDLLVGREWDTLSPFFALQSTPSASQSRRLGSIWCKGAPNPGDATGCWGFWRPVNSRTSTDILLVIASLLFPLNYISLQIKQW